MFLLSPPIKFQSIKYKYLLIEQLITLFSFLMTPSTHKNKWLQAPKEMKTLPTRGILNSPETWIQQKAQFDTKLWGHPKSTWVVDNKYYDLTSFIDKHPGGSRWITSTQGQDITQLFYLHHLNFDKAKTILDKYQAGQTVNKINRYTFEANGFYQTLRRKVLSTFSKQQIQDSSKTKVLAFVSLTMFIISLLSTAYYQSFILATLTGYLMVLLVGIGHNFVHQKQNIYRYLYQFTGFSHKQWEIYHAISHHALMNTELDYQIAAFEPVAYFLRTMPQNNKFIELILQAFFLLMIPLNLCIKLILKIVRRKKIYWELLVPYTEFIIFYIFSGDVFRSFLLFLYMQGIFGFIFTKQIFCGHRTQQVWTQGCEKISDFGEHTMASTCDTTTQMTGLLSFMFFAGFNIHSVHHLFPTADHSQFPKILPLVIQTCKQFGIKYRCKNKFECMVSISKNMVSRIAYSK